MMKICSARRETHCKESVPFIGCVYMVSTNYVPFVYTVYNYVMDILKL